MGNDCRVLVSLRYFPQIHSGDCFSVRSRRLEFSLGDGLFLKFLEYREKRGKGKSTATICRLALNQFLKAEASKEKTPPNESGGV